MELLPFFGDLLIKPDSDLAKLINKAFRLLLNCLLAYCVWISVGGIVVIPKEISVEIIWNYIFSGQILIPIILVYVIGRVTRIFQNFIFPLVIALVRKLIWKIHIKITVKRTKNYKSRIKRQLAILYRIGFISIVSNKVKRGPLFRIYETFAKGIDLPKASKEHLNLISLLSQITIIWVYVVRLEGFPSSILYYIIFSILIFLILYLPLNLATLYIANDYKKILYDIVVAVKKTEINSISSQSRIRQ